MKYITTQILIACRSGHKSSGTELYKELAKTLAERVEVLAEFERKVLNGEKDSTDDIHRQLAQSIAEHRQVMKQWELQIIGQPRKAA